MSNISICIITKNEYENLKTCLDRIKGLNCEIVVVDTGSTDSSKEIAHLYTPHVYDFNWCNDFSAARNYAISKATNEYIFMLDTDEFVDKFDLDGLEKLIENNPSSIGRMHRKNLYQSNGNDMVSNELVNRIFPKKLYRYEGRIHEQITRIPSSRYDLSDKASVEITGTSSDKSAKEMTGQYDNTYIAPIYTTHIGYQGGKSDRISKAERNRNLLLDELEKNSKDPYILFQLANSYFYEQKYAEAIPYLERAMEFPLNINLSYVHSMVNLYGYCLIYTKRYSDAIMLEGVYDDFKGDADYLFVLGIIYMYNAQFENAVRCFLESTQISSCVVEGVNSYSAFYNIGVIFECLGDKSAALDYYHKAGKYTPALEGIERCQHNQPISCNPSTQK